MSWVRNLKKQMSKRIGFYTVRHNQAVGISYIKKKIKQKEKIRIGFYVIFDSVFPAESVFKELLKDPMFAPFILVIPDTSRGEDNMFEQMEKTYKTLSEKYKKCVYKSYDQKIGAFIDYSNDADMVFFANPYDDMTHEYYRIVNLTRKRKLTLYTNYGYQISNITKGVFNCAAFNALWKNFLLDNHEKELLSANDTRGYNGVLVEYSKLDRLATIKKQRRKRTKIIIAPHHTVMEWKNGLELSNFIKYHQFFIQLFKKYSDIDFVFRPHPLLWINLQNNNMWTKKQIDNYIESITKLPNVEYQNGGSYLETFVNSDALIHDCGSFSAEYLFVNKPCCYLLKNKEMSDQNSNDFHKKCVSLHYPAYNEKDVIEFIEKCVLQKQDSKFADRKKFVQEELAFEHPHVTHKICEYIKQEFK